MARILLHRPSMWLTPWLLVGQLDSSDALDLLDSSDPWLRDWAERVARRSAEPRVPLGSILERAARAAPGASRRDSFSFALDGRVAYRRRADEERWSQSFTVSIRFAWDALWLQPADERLFLPREERTRRTACKRLQQEARQRAGAPRSWLFDRAWFARREALGCLG